jgi:hypothetical protein
VICAELGLFDLIYDTRFIYNLYQLSKINNIYSQIFQFSLDHFCQHYLTLQGLSSIWNLVLEYSHDDLITNIHSV